MVITEDSSNWRKYATSIHISRNCRTMKRAKKTEAADGLRIANDARTLLFGQLNQQYGSPPPAPDPAAGWQGPVGYVIE